MTRAATPVEDACRLFPASNLLVVNVSGRPAVRRAARAAPIREVMVEPRRCRRRRSWAVRANRFDDVLARGLGDRTAKALRATFRSWPGR